MGGRAEGLACADPVARTSIAWAKMFLSYFRQIQQMQGKLLNYILMNLSFNKPYYKMSANNVIIFNIIKSW